MTDTAACLLAFERPHYLRQTVESLENLLEKDTVDWYIFQDGPVNKFSGRRVARDRDVKIARRILQNADLPNKTIMSNDYNLGIPNQYYQMYQLFDDEYDTIIGFEDDIVVSKYGLVLKKRLLEEFPYCVPTLYTNRSVEGIDVQHNLDLMVKNYTGSSWHTFAVKEYMYRDIEDRYEEYLRLVGSRDYKQRPHQKILQEFGSEISSNDAVMQRLLVDNGYYRIMPFISRALYIGIEGEHSSSDSYLRDFEGNLGDIEYESDKCLRDFRLKVRQEVKEMEEQ